MSVSVLTYSAHVGAFATICRNIATGLDSRDVEVDVLYLADAGPDAIAGYPPSSRFERVGRRARTCWPGIARHLRGRRPDALISLGWILNPAAVAAVALARTSTPLFLNEQSALSYKTQVEHRHQRRLRHLDRAARWLYPRATAVTGASADVVADLVDRIGLDPRRIRLEVVPNAVDARHVIARSLERSPDVVAGPGPVFVNVARHARQKNLSLLLEAFRRYLDDGGAGTLVLVGTGPQTDELHRLARGLHLLGRVRFAGHLSNPFPQMASATAFVLSSEEEGFGLVLVEAMALGVPVISTDCPGGPPEILDGGAGLLVPSRDVAALAGAMRRVADDADLRGRLARQGRRRAEAYSPAAIGDRWMRLIAPEGPGTRPHGRRGVPR